MDGKLGNWCFGRLLDRRLSRDEAIDGRILRNGLNRMLDRKLGRMRKNGLDRTVDRKLGKRCFGRLLGRRLGRDKAIDERVWSNGLDGTLVRGWMMLGSTDVGRSR